MAETRKGQFALSVAKWVEKVRDREDEVLRAVTLGLVSDIVTRSPVGHPSLWKHPPPPGYVGGRFRNGWFVGINQPPTDLPDGPDATGEAAKARAAVVVAGARVGPPIYIVNNLPYAIPIEYGHSTLAPAGVIRLSVVEFQRIVDEAAKEIEGS